MELNEINSRMEEIRIELDRLNVEWRSLVEMKRSIEESSAKAQVDSWKCEGGDWNKLLAINLSRPMYDYSMECLMGLGLVRLGQWDEIRQAQIGVPTHSHVEDFRPGIKIILGFLKQFKDGHVRIILPNGDRMDIHPREMTGRIIRGNVHLVCKGTMQEILNSAYEIVVACRNSFDDD